MIPSTWRWSLILVLAVLLSGCASFKPATLDPATGRFPTTVEVSKKDILAYRPLAGIEDVKFVYVRVQYPHQPDKFQLFVQDSLVKMGFKSALSERELAQLIIKSNLSEYVSNISDLVALNKLSKVLGPFLILDANLLLVGDCHFKFNLEVTDPSSTDMLLKVSRFRTNWMDMDTEINYPMMNVVKRWYDDSVKLGPPDSKPMAREPAI